MTDPTGDVATLETEAAAGRPLTGARICLVFEHSLSHYTRILQEIAGLQEAGASIRLLTSHEATEGASAGLVVTRAPLPEFSTVSTRIPGSTLSWRALRVADNIVRRVIRSVVGRIEIRLIALRRRRVLARLASQVDLFWVIDYPSLPAVVKVARRASVKVLYETVDLVPEYDYEGERRRMQQLADERRLVGLVDGFVTACDSYADYYVERYGERELARRPVVRDNMPAQIVPEIRATARPLRILFLGSLMFDRPVMELVEAVARSSADVSLTLQGKDYLDGAPAARIAELGAQRRVSVLEPCAPEAIVETAREYDVGIVALRGENENERRASTSKLFTYMAAGLAILGSDLPGIARVVNEYDNGILVAGMDPASWSSAIERMASMPLTDVDAMKQRSLEAARLHSWGHQRPAFIAEFVRALHGGESAGSGR